MHERAHKGTNDRNGGTAARCPSGFTLTAAADSGASGAAFPQLAGLRTCGAWLLSTLLGCVFISWFVSTVAMAQTNSMIQTRGLCYQRYKIVLFRVLGFSAECCVRVDYGRCANGGRQDKALRGMPRASALELSHNSTGVCRLQRTCFWERVPTMRTMTAIAKVEARALSSRHPLNVCALRARSTVAASGRARGNLRSEHEARPPALAAVRQSPQRRGQVRISPRARARVRLTPLLTAPRIYEHTPGDRATHNRAPAFEIGELLVTRTVWPWLSTVLAQVRRADPIHRWRTSRNQVGVVRRGRVDHAALTLRLHRL